MTKKTISILNRYVGSLMATIALGGALAVTLCEQAHAQDTSAFRQITCPSARLSE